MSVQFEIALKIWLQMHSGIEAYALYGSAMWGLLLNCEFENWYKNPFEAIHVEF